MSNGTFKLRDSKLLVPAWIAVLFGIITPIGFSTNAMLTKHLISQKVGFDATTLAFSSQFVVNVIVLIAGIIYWSSSAQKTFEPILFWYGLFGSAFNSLGIVCVQNAVALGPAGPAQALATTCCLLLTIFEAIKDRQAPSTLEIIGLVIGTFGALIIVIPRWFENKIRIIK